MKDAAHLTIILMLILLFIVACFVRQEQLQSHRELVRIREVLERAWPSNEQYEALERKP
jgi:hypothetical protein